MSKTRDIRLYEDLKILKELTESCQYLEINNAKSPFEKINEIEKPQTEYMLTYTLKGYIDSSGKIRDIHRVKMTLPNNYPITEPPIFRFEDDFWHTNVYSSGEVCLGFGSTNKWKPTFPLEDLIIDIAKIICFKKDSYNTKSPANSACNQNWISSHQIPVDKRNIIPKNLPDVTVIQKNIPDVIVKKIPPIIKTNTPVNYGSPPNSDSSSSKPITIRITKDSIPKKIKILKDQLKT